jgi:hypothetical protein
MIEREIPGESLGGHPGEEEAFASLLHVSGARANGSSVARAEIFPMEDLT